MSQEMGMFWLGISVLIAFWGMSQYNPRPNPRLPNIGRIGFISGMFDECATKTQESQS